jgi:hypothetical protein
MRQNILVSERTVSRLKRCERGESGMGLLVGAIVIGIIIAVLTGLQNYFYEGKEAKVERRELQKFEAHQKTLPVHRAPSGYQVKY